MGVGESRRQLGKCIRAAPGSDLLGGGLAPGRPLDLGVVLRWAVLVSIVVTLAQRAGGCAPPPTPASQALLRGAEWLTGQLRDGGFLASESDPAMRASAELRFGHDALGLLALAHACSAKDLRVANALSRKLGQRVDALTEGDGAYSTYSLAVWLMATEKLRIRNGEAAPSSPAGPVRLAAVRLLAAQAESGLWGYGGRGGSALGRATPDLSNTQFTLEGLSAAHALGWRSSASKPALLRAAAALTATVREVRTGGDGRFCGWSYLADGRGAVTGSCTASGVLALSLCRSLLASERRPLQADTEEVLGAALRWMRASFSAEGNPFAVTSVLPSDSRDTLLSSGHHMIWLYTSGACLDALGVRGSWGQEWYGRGEAYLVAKQETDGSWLASGEDDGPPRAIGGGGVRSETRRLRDSCFALLFLRAERAEGTAEVTPR
jgi:hypothetical protein